MSSARPTKKARVDFSDTFTVIAGLPPDAKTFTLPRELFLPRSPFFRAAVASKWSQGKPVDLSDHAFEVVNDYVNCVYSGEVPAPDVKIPKSIEEEVDNLSMPVMPQSASKNTWAKFGPLISLYVLADKLGDLVAANLTMDPIVAHSAATRQNFADDHKHEIYNSTTPGSALRKLYTHQFVHENDSPINTAFVPPQLLGDIYAEHVRLKAGVAVEDQVKEVFEVPATAQERCYFHQHNDEHPQCSD